MNKHFLDSLVCPECAGPLELNRRAEEANSVLQRELRCATCEGVFPIRNRIPRLVQGPTYAESFGWQWNRFHKLQRDSYNGTTIVRNTIIKRSGWLSGDLRGKRILECRSGSGNGTEILRLGALLTRVRQWLVEPWFRFWFAAIERLRVFNDCQLLVLEVPD